MRGLVLLCAVLVLGACDERVTGPTTPLNADFVLAPGQAAAVAQSGAQVRFDRVSNDSRCPADAICIQGGDALVHISVLSSGSRREYELHTGNMRPIVHNELTVHLVQLIPYPYSSRTIAPDEYRATLRVTR